MKKRIYELPDLEMLKIYEADVITTSPIVLPPQIINGGETNESNDVY